MGKDKFNPYEVDNVADFELGVGDIDKQLMVSEEVRKYIGSLKNKHDNRFNSYDDVLRMLINFFDCRYKEKRKRNKSYDEIFSDING